MSAHVWYASYGSNLAENRFLHYLEGGSPLPGFRQHFGARTAVVPEAQCWQWCDHELYFAGLSESWGGGVAFLDPEPGSGRVLVRMRKLLKEQFEDIMAQENDLRPGELIIGEIPRLGERHDQLDAWYGTLLGLGDKDGSPIVSFTNKLCQAETSPSSSYLGTILSGLLDGSPAADAGQAAKYLVSLRGVAGNWHFDDVQALANNSVD